MDLLPCPGGAAGAGAEGAGAAGFTSVFAAGASMCCVTPPDLDGAEKYVSPRLVAKNTAARTAVVRERKLAAPAEPKRLPAEPLPKAAPMSAPLPCCRSTSTTMPTAARMCNTSTSVCMCVETAFQRPSAARQIATNSSATSEAPPTNPPSTSGIAKISAAFAAFTLPP